MRDAHLDDLEDVIRLLNEDAIRRPPPRLRALRSHGQCEAP